MERRFRFRPKGCDETVEGGFEGLGAGKEDGSGGDGLRSAGGFEEAPTDTIPVDSVGEGALSGRNDERSGRSG